MSRPDVTIYGDQEGRSSVFLFTPLTAAGREWIDENVSAESWQWIGGGLAVDHRYAGNLAEAMTDDGLVVE